MSGEQARVVVIGGGITGCSVAYHLALAGWTDVLLVEKAQLTAGSTCQAAGLVTAFNPSATMMAFRRYSIELYRSLGAFETVGSLRLASSPEQLHELERTASRARGIGLDAGVIGAEEARRLMPAISPESLYGAVHLAGDGHLDPHGATHAVADAARALGVRIRTGVRVTGFEVSARREITAVLTDAGPIATELVVNAAGMWAPQVAAMVGGVHPVDTGRPPAHRAQGRTGFRAAPRDAVLSRSGQPGLRQERARRDGVRRVRDGPAITLGGRRAVGARSAVAAARLGAVLAADGRRDPSLPVPRRCGGHPPGVSPGRDDPRCRSIAWATPRGPRVLGRGRALAQRVRRRRWDRPGDGRLDHRRGSGRGCRAVPSVAVRRRLPGSGVCGRSGPRDVRRLLPAPISV